MRSKQPKGPDEPGRLSDLALQLEAVSGADEEVAGEAHQEERDDGGNLARLFELLAQEVKPRIPTSRISASRNQKDVSFPGNQPSTRTRTVQIDQVIGPHLNNLG